MSVVASDDFNRADNADVGATWDSVGSALRITSNAAVFSSGNDADSAELHTTTLAADHWAEAVIKSPIAGGAGQGYGVCVRGAPGASFSYYRAVGNSDGWELTEFGSGGFVGSLASGTSTTFANGDTIYLEAQGSTLVVKKGTVNGAGGTTLTTQTDATLNANTRAGIGYSSSGGGSGVDAFVMGDFAGGGGTTRGKPFGHRGTAFNGGRTFDGIIGRGIWQPQRNSLHSGTTDTSGRESGRCSYSKPALYTRRLGQRLITPPELYLPASSRRTLALLTR